MLEIGTPARVANKRTLVLSLRIMGTIDVLAIVATLMPDAWIELGHQWTGMGEFPRSPIAFYLARSASALYALHGIMIVFMSFEVERFLPLIRFLSKLAIIHGLVVVAVDWTSEMPFWWVLAEGPIFALTGAWILAVSREK